VYVFVFVGCVCVYGVCMCVWCLYVWCVCHVACIVYLGYVVCVWCVYVCMVCSVSVPWLLLASRPGLAGSRYCGVGGTETVEGEQGLYLLPALCL